MTRSGHETKNIGAAMAGKANLFFNWAGIAIGFFPIKQMDKTDIRNTGRINALTFPNLQ